MDPKLRILVVDDEPRALELFQRTLRGVGDVVAAQSGEQALGEIRTARPDIVVSDQRMPGLTGIELLSEVCRMDEAIGRVLLTGYADLGATLDAINQARVHAYLTKPCPPREVQETVRNVVARIQNEPAVRALAPNFASAQQFLDDFDKRIANLRDIAQTARRSGDIALATMLIDEIEATDDLCTRFRGETNGSSDSGAR